MPRRKRERFSFFFLFLYRFLSFFLFIFFATSYGYNQKNLAGHKLVSWITFLLISLQRRLRRNSFENIWDEPHHINDNTNDFFFRYEITINLEWEKYCSLPKFGFEEMNILWIYLLPKCIECNNYITLSYEIKFLRYYIIL